MRERMRKLLSVIKPQSQNDSAHNKPILSATGPGTARVRVNDPLAVGIEDFLWDFRLARLRLLVSRKPNRKQKCQ